MAHFARVVDGIVEKIHVLNNAVMTNEEGNEDEKLGCAFLSDLHKIPASELIQCSYNANFRGTFPGPGFSYDPDLDEFLPPFIPDEPVEPELFVE